MKFILQSKNMIRYWISAERRSATIIVAALFYLGPSYGLSAFGSEVFFSPSPDCENRITQAISDSQKEIVAAVYSVNNKKIVDALISAKKRGVKVRFLTDSTQAAQKGSRAINMIDEGLDLRVNSGSVNLVV